LYPSAVKKGILTNATTIKIETKIILIFKILGLFILFSLVKAIVPRYRFDQLMRLGWKIFLPLSLIWVVLTASFLFFLDMLPATG